MVARSEVEVSGPKSRPWGRTWRFSSSCTSAGLHARPQLLLVHLEHLVHVAGEVEDDRAVHRLPGERGAAAAREHGHVLAVGDLDHRLHVAGVARDDHADRLHLVHRRVGGVQELGEAVEADVALDDPAQLVLEIVHRGANYTMRMRAAIVAFAAPDARRRPPRPRPRRRR